MEFHARELAGKTIVSKKGEFTHSIYEYAKEDYR